MKENENNENNENSENNNKNNKNNQNNNNNENSENENSDNENNENSENEDDDDINDSENSLGYDPIELRKYELKKLKYYYAVIYCDSISTASYLYTTLDGKEIERTQCFIDMRFIPNSLKKFPYQPKEICDHIPANKEYVQKFHPNNALQDTKVKLTYDENNKEREDIIERAFKKEGFNEEEINEFLVSSDDEDDLNAVKNFISDFDENESEKNSENNNENNNNNNFNLLKKKRKMRKFKDGETIEIRFNRGFEGINNNIKNNNSDDDENKKKEKSKWEKFKENKKNIAKLKKMEERRKRKEINLKRKGENYDENKNENVVSKNNELDLLVDNTIKNKEKFKFNPDDKRFNTNNDNDFAIDPTNKNYKKIKKHQI